MGPVPIPGRVTPLYMRSIIYFINIMLDRVRSIEYS